MAWYPLIIKDFAHILQEEDLTASTRKNGFLNNSNYFMKIQTKLTYYFKHSDYLFEGQRSKKTAPYNFFFLALWVKDRPFNIAKSLWGFLYMQSTS